MRWSIDIPSKCVGQILVSVPTASILTIIFTLLHSSSLTVVGDLRTTTSFGLTESLEKNFQINTTSPSRSSVGSIDDPSICTRSHIEFRIRYTDATVPPIDNITSAAVLNTPMKVMLWRGKYTTSQKIPDIPKLMRLIYHRYVVIIELCWLYSRIYDREMKEFTSTGFSPTIASCYECPWVW